jgi:hypothetical protein
MFAPAETKPKGAAKGLQTEYEFTLPRGYVDPEGNLHRNGVMRLATALDEIVPMKDPRVKSNPAYLTVILLTRVITRLGTLEDVSSVVIERLFSADFAYLQDLYRRINEAENVTIPAQCPNCNHVFEVELVPSGE